MKRKSFIKTLTMLSLIALLITGCNSEPVVGPQGEQGIPGQTGPEGEPGEDGISIVSVEKTGTDGNVDTYTITFSNGDTTTFTVTNGTNGSKGDSGENGLTPNIGDNGNWWIGETDTGVKAEGTNGSNGVSITGIELITSENGVDTYRISFSNGEHFDFTITNGAKGEQGETGQDGTAVLTGHGAPLSDTGKIGDSYIDLDNWDYYVKTSEGWELSGNIKGATGQTGNTGVSIESTYIDENGDLIVTFSNGDIVNAGHIKDVDDHTVKFYCDDLLVDTQIVKHGDKVEKPELEDFVVKHWYIDKGFEYEWYWYGCVVTEDMSLYGDYQAVPKTLSYDKTANITIDTYGFGTSVQFEKEVCVSKASESADYLTTLDSRGILFNKSEIGLITELTVNIESEGFASAKLYYGNTPFSFEHSLDLTSGNNVVDLTRAEYFTIQNTGNESININSLNLEYEKKATFVDDSLPTVIINTKNSQAVTSRTTYVTCDVSTGGAEKDVTQLKAQIKLRGNSTAGCPKKPYRIKLDKKNSLFGYTKAKNWALLAEYMDGSNMHNYTALKFAKMVRGEETFGVNPLHVNVTLNGENIGIYTFCEHIEAKEGRLNIEQDNIWEKNFDEINFYIERDLSTAQDSTETEGVTYFKVPLENYTLSQYYFALKYPEKDDFEEKLEDGTTVPHDEEFQIFFNALKNYMTDICNKFVDYYHDKNEFSNVAASVDMESLALYAVTDQAFGESDHSQKSFKMYRENGGLLQFGPNWDYDSCAYSLPYQGTYVLNPFTVGGSYNRTSFGEKWGNMLFNDTTNGLPLFKAIWDNITSEQLNGFINAQLQEMSAISFSSVYDCERWMHNQYYSMFDNQLYYWRFVANQLPYLKSFYL